jgi:outer membrane protein OmpA-like peptidoglycan-associated protein
LQKIRNKFHIFYHAWIHRKRISGYADSVGSAEKNIILSKKRSEYIAGLMQRNFDVPENYVVDYFGEKEPASLTDNAVNRRVEIYLCRDSNIKEIRITGL